MTRTVTIRPIDLPVGPRETMARLRGHGDFALFESAMTLPGRAEWSYIAGPGVAFLESDESLTRLRLRGRVIRTWTDPFEALSELAARDGAEVRVEGERPPGMGFIGGWAGMLGYDLVRHIEDLPRLAAHDPELPRQWWMAVDQVLAFHHPSGQWWQATSRGDSERWPYSSSGREAVWNEVLARAQTSAPRARGWRAGELQRRTGRAGFEAGVRTIREALSAGEVLQVNLARREEAAFEGDAWSLYEELVAAHPAPFAAFIETPRFAVASCSPERFLRVCGDEVEARPIKGTMARGATPREDEQQRERLARSEKDRAENLMIVDLMRNDLGRVARLGSVRVHELFALEPYASVWQMVSTVRARLRADCEIGDLLRACWPPGSMTGAPKVKAMQIIEALEPVRRGCYAGSLGYLGCDGSLDLSVVIRSAVVVPGRVMLHLGGGIVADSSPEAEWEETVAKGARLVAVLREGGTLQRGAERTRHIVG